MPDAVGLVFPVRQRAGQGRDVGDLLLQVGLGSRHINAHSGDLLLQVAFGGVEGVVYLTDLLDQFGLGRPYPIVHRPRAILVYQVDSAGKLLAQFTLGDLILDLLEDRASISARHSGNHCRGLREERAEVAGAIHQARPEEETLPGAQALHDVLVLRISQVGQLGGQAQIGAFAVPQLRSLGVLGARWKAPLDADAKQQTFGIQERNGRRQAFLAIQLSQIRAFPDRGDVEATDRPYPSQVSASVDSYHINRSSAGPLQTNPVAVVLAPFNIVSNGILHYRPSDGHGADRDALINHVGRRQRHARRRLHGGHRDDADRALVQLGTGIDRCKLARIELKRGDLVLAFLCARRFQHAEQLHRQVVVVDCPLQLRFRLDPVIGSHRDRAPSYRLHGARLSSPIRQVQDQTITGLDRRVTVQGHHAAGCGGDPATVRPPGNQFISHRNDVARQRNATLHAGLEGDGAVLAVAQQRPLTAALGLGGAGAANRRQLDWAIAVPALERQIGHRNDVGVVVVGRVVVADQGPAVVRVALRAAIDEVAVDDVGPGEHVVDVLGARHIRLHEQRTVGPVHHAPVDGCQVTQQRPGLGAALQVHVAQIARLLTTHAIRHQLVAVLGDAVHLPLVDHPRLDALTQTETIFDTQPVGHERRVVGPGLLEGAVPYACVGTGYRVVVGRYRPTLGLALHGDSRDVLELLGVKLDVQQRGVRVAQLLVDDLGVASDGHRVGDCAAVGVWGNPAHTQHPAGGRLGQVHTHGALVAIGGLAVHGAEVCLDVGAAVGGDIDRVLDAVAVGVAVAVLLRQARPSHAHAHGRELGVAQGAGERVVAAQLDVDGGFVLNRRNALDVLLLDGAWAPLPLHAWEIHIAAGVHDRRVVEVDVTVGWPTVEFALTHGQQDLGDVRRLQAVRCLDRSFRLAVAALGAGDFQMIYRAHAFLRAKKNRQLAVYAFFWRYALSCASIEAEIIAPPQRRSPMQIGTGLPLAVVFLALPKA
ncbi:hypothetical protein PSNVIR_02888 [Pseudomonas sp. Nvir]|nr:hypothetical protein PSNVIR_02888 [Pseudomonas sp. Nvir]